MNIQGFQKTTLLDYPKHVAATIFMGGCNFQCPFCHNKDLVLFPQQNSPMDYEEILSYLKKRKNILDGVCITGGEPSLQEHLLPFLASIKELGLSVKLDTNGYRPEILKRLCRERVVDYVAMDLKGIPEKYPEICGLSKMDLSRICASVSFLLEGTVQYEFRTTVMREFHREEDFRLIGAWILGADSYYLQSYQLSPQVISPVFSAYTLEEMTSFEKILQPYVSHVEIRGS